VVLGGWRLSQGNPSGAALAKVALWLPLTLFCRRLCQYTVRRRPEDKVPFVFFFGAVSLVLLSLVWLLGLAQTDFVKSLLAALLAVAFYVGTRSKARA
jgi:hypothetical protein